MSALLAALACAHLALAPPTSQPIEPGASPALTAPSTPPPPKGYGLLGWGITGVVVGTFGVVSGVVVAFTSPGHAGPFAPAPITIGGAMVILGGLGIHYGKVRRRRYTDWETATYGEPMPMPETIEAQRPPRGLGLTVSGAIGVALGATGTGLSVQSLSLEGPGGSASRAPLVLSVGALLSGIPMVVVGAVRIHRHETWEWEWRKRGIAWRLQLAPGTVGAGVSGRF